MASPSWDCPLFPQYYYLRLNSMHYCSFCLLIRLSCTDRKAYVVTVLDFRYRQNDGDKQDFEQSLFDFLFSMENAHACERRARNEGGASSVSRLTSRAWLFSCLTKERYEKINRKIRDTYHANAKEQRAYHPHANRISLFKVLKKKNRQVTNLIPTLVPMRVQHFSGARLMTFNCCSTTGWGGKG